MSEIKQDLGMYYGFDIGGTKIQLAAFDQEFNLVKQQRQATPIDDYSEFLNKIQSMVRQFDAQLQSIGSVGIGFPGIRDYHNGAFISVNIPCVIGQQLELDLSDLLQRPVRVENDCKCFALSEAILGSAKDYQNVFGAIIGTGAGGGQVTAGKLCTGVHGFAGEWGHIGINAYILDKYNIPVWPCACGLQGCAEQYISGSGLQNLYKFKYQQTHAITLESISAEQIMLLVDSGDQLASEVFEIYVDMLASSLATIQLSYDTDAIVLGGGMSNVRALYQKLPAYIKQHLFDRAQAPVVLAPEFGDASGVRGAALLHRAEI
ncbi:MAG: hypothetical protein OFPI_23580 [Osedax symbiont Rs2]|nr:MAG: hypothetical protein OFPI_23580 [Osedax symbiont Rs2]